MNGAEVTQAWNGAEAVELLPASRRPFAFDAILMDMQMPVMDGCEAARPHPRPATGRTRATCPSSP